MAGMLFEDVFEVSDVNPDGKKFDRVTRIVAKGDNYEMDLVLDYNNQVYKLPAGSRFIFCLARTLSLDGTADPNEFNQSDEPSLMDSYEYVMHGKVFKISAAAAKESKMEIFASFGGLLMSLRGDPRNLSKIELDMRIYCLIKKPS